MASTRAENSKRPEISQSGSSDLGFSWPKRRAEETLARFVRPEPPHVVSQPAEDRLNNGVETPVTPQSFDELPSTDQAGSAHSSADVLPDRRSLSVSILTREAARAGFALLFLVNGVIAVIAPDELLPVLQDNPITGGLGVDAQRGLVRFAALNDFGIGALAISRRNDTLAILWAGVWMGVIALTKTLSLLGG